MSTELLKKSQSIKDLNNRLLQFAIEDVELPKKKDRSNSGVFEGESRFTGLVISTSSQGVFNAEQDVSTAGKIMTHSA